MPLVEMFYFAFISLFMSVLGLDPASKIVADRFAVYWNRTNPSCHGAFSLPCTPAPCWLYTMGQTLRGISGVVDAQLGACS
ncbi:hypothetical protein PO909_008003 [Leuciscus waleckii]